MGGNEKRQKNSTIKPLSTISVPFENPEGEARPKVQLGRRILIDRFL